VDAFAALIAAEAKTPLAPSSAPTPQPPAIDDALIEKISQRVLARLTDQARPTILETAERLVREEIERIKKSGNR
jgi:hypothetical protein